MSNEHDPGDEAPTAAAAKRYYAVLEFHDNNQGSIGLSHHVCARDLMHALEVLSRVDFSDAASLSITEMDAQQAGLLRVRDEREDRPSSYSFALAELGDHFCEEY